MPKVFGCAWVLGVGDSHGAAQSSGRDDRIGRLPGITM